jgi:hypothetical protein
MTHYMQQIATPWARVPDEQSLPFLFFHNDEHSFAQPQIVRIITFLRIFTPTPSYSTVFFPFLLLTTALRKTPSSANFTKPRRSSLFFLSSHALFWSAPLFTTTVSCCHFTKLECSWNYSLSTMATLR